MVVGWLHRLGRDHVTNSAGSPVLVGSVLQARPAVLWLVRWFPSFFTRLLMVRSVLLAALSLPVTSLVLLVAVWLRVPEVVGVVLLVAGWLLSVLVVAVGVFGVAAVAVGLLVAGFGWKLLMASRFPNFDLDPWLFLGIAGGVVVPTMFSWVGVLVLAVGVVELWLGVVSPWVRVWRLGWQFRRKWPMLWATVTSTTARPQASHGGGTSALFGATKKDSARELLNHPALGPVPDFSVSGSVGWRLFRPNGQLVKRIEDLSGTVCEAFPAAIRVEVAQDNPGQDSFGWLRVWFVEPPDVLDGVEDAGFVGDGDPLFAPRTSPGVFAGGSNGSNGSNGAGVVSVVVGAGVNGSAPRAVSVPFDVSTGEVVR